MEYAGLVIHIVFVFILLGGIIMTIVGLPGNIIILLAGLGYGFYEHFENINYAVLVIVFGIFIVAEIVEFIAGLVGAGKEKASKRAMIAPFLGTIIGAIWGTALLPVIGSLLGALLGAFIVTFLAEYSKTKDSVQAGRVAKGVIKGQVLAILVKTVAAVGMSSLLLYQLKWQ